MLALENADEILQILDRFTKQKSKEIPPELEEYIDFVAKTGDTVYRWPTVQYLFREKLRNVIKEFHDTTASIEDLPQCPNVDQFNYESMKTLLFERFDHFQAAPFTIQRLCELLTAPKKHYSRLDKFMRALEKNILVVSTTEPGRKPTDVENGDESINGDILSAISVGIETTKNILKGDVENTNGNSKNNGTVNDVPIDEVASSSGVTKSDNAEVSVAVTVTVAEPSKDQPKVESSEKDLAEEKPVNDKPTVDDKPKVDAEPTVDDKKDDIPVAKEEQSIDEPSEVSTTDKTDKAVIEETAPEQIKEENAKVEESSEAIMKEIPSDANIVEQSIDVKIDKVEPISPVKEPIVSDKPPTPKRACSDDEDDPIENGDRSAKKIKLDTSESIECEKAVEPQPEVPKVESTEESEALKVDEAKKEDELLEDVVDSVLAVEQSKVDSSTDTPAISDESVIEKEPIDKPIENPIEPVVEDKPQAPIESITPVSTNDVVPTEPIAEEKSLETADNNITEPIVTTPATPVDMNVEENETAVPAVVVASETPDTAMEAAPIKADEEMDVDESNSTDAMDL